VLGVLEVVLAGDTVAARLRVASQLNVFLGDMQRGAPDLDVRTIAFEGTGQGIRALTVTAPHPLVVLLSLPHRWFSS
jgi:hypothetical protein